ncbi:MAG: hypothetical protein Q9224_003669 [Gallowayella concinna]
MNPHLAGSMAFGANFGGTQIGQQNILNESRNQLQTITDWFSPVSFAQKQQDVYKHEYGNSKQSFFESAKFISWKTGIQQHTQTTPNLLASLWPQLYISHNGHPPPYMENVYRAHVYNRTKPDLGQVQSIIQTTVDELERAYILVDGLDEIADVNRQEDLIDSIRTLLAQSNTDGAKLHVLVTSRQPNHLLEGDSIEIQSTLEEIKAMVEQRIKMPRTFRPSIRAEVARNPEIQSEILDKVASKANGIFLIADLQLRSLSSITNIRDLREALDKLPEKLNDYYEIAWTRISSQEEPLKSIAHHTIGWLYFGRRLLTVEELRHALAVRAGDASLSSDSLTIAIDILETCQGLVILETHGNSLRLMHSSVRDFIERQHQQQFENIQCYLTSTCLAYLCLKVFQEYRCDFVSEEDADSRAKPGDNIASGKILSYRLLQYPFLDYAAENWGYHAQGYAEEECAREIHDFLLLLEHPLENAHMVHPQVFHPSKRRHVNYTFQDLHPLRVAVSYGLEATARVLISCSLASADRLRLMGIQDHLLLALLEALENGQLSIADDLLRAGVDPAPPGELPLTTLDQTFIYTWERPKTALDKSVFYGHNEAAALLLRRKTGGSMTAKTMEFAIVVENLDVLDQYLSRAKDRTRRLGRTNKILHFATRHGKLKAVKFSLEQGASIESEDSERGLTSLGLAVIFGQDAVVRFLLDAGSDITAEISDITGECETNQSLLQAAATSQLLFKRRLELVSGFALGSSSADIYDSTTAQLEKRLNGWLTLNPRPLELLDNPDFMTAMREDSGHGKIISMLLDHGADATVLGDSGESILHLAVLSEPRMNAVLQNIRSHPNLGLDVNARDRNGRTPLHYAAAACSANVMELLIEHGADVAATDSLAVTTLHFAVFNRKCIEVAQKYGCRVDKTHAFLGTPLDFARCFTDPDRRVVEALENSLIDATRQGSLQGEPVHSNKHAPDTNSKVYRDIYWWMMRKSCEHEVLCRWTIRTSVKGSQQQGYLKMRADEKGAAERRKREWNLVLDA